MLGQKTMWCEALFVGAKHSFSFLTLTLSSGRDNMAPETFDVLQCKWFVVPACTHNLGNHLKFRALDIEIYLRSLSHLDMSSRRWVYDWVRTPSLPHLWVNMGSKNRFFHKSLKMILLSFLTIFDDLGVQIWCLKMISDFKKMRFSTFSKIEILGPNPSEMLTLRLQILNFLCWDIQFWIILLL